MIKQEIIDEIFNRAKIEDVVSDYTAIRKKGINYAGCCPFHDEKTASFVVSPAKGIYHCFGCGKGGNVFSFVQEHEHCTFPEAAHILAKKYGIQIEETELNDEQRAAMLRRESINIVLKEVQTMFHNMLGVMHKQDYLRNRGIADETVEYFGAGYCGNDGQYSVEWLRQKAFREDTALAAGLLVKNENGTLRDKFIDRITFPYLSPSGQVLGFTGRALKWDKESKYPKYLNSPDTEVFKKGKVLFGIFQAKSEITRADSVFIVEGQFDVLHMVQSGIRNTIAGSGTALTQEQCRLLLRYTSDAHLVYDGDKAGRAACLKNMDTLLSEGFAVSVYPLPEGEDPDTYLQSHTADELRALAVKGIHYKYRTMMEDAADDADKITAALKEVAQSIALIPDKELQKVHISQLAKKEKANAEMLTKLVREAKKPAPEIAEQSGIFGIEEAKELIADSNKRAIITFEKDYFIRHFGELPVLLIAGELQAADIQQLRTAAKEFESELLKDEFQTLYDAENNPAQTILTLETLRKNGLKIIFIDEESNENLFVDYYLKIQSFFIQNRPTSKRIFSDNAARIIALEDNSTYVLEVENWARIMGFKKTEFTQYLKPFLEEQKSKVRSKIETASYEIDTDILNGKIPDYVDMSFFSNYHFFPVQDKKGRPYSYCFQKEGGFELISNFHITPLFHIYSKSEEDNRRIIELNHANFVKYPFKTYTEVSMNGFVNLTEFRKIGLKEGGFYFNGTSRHMDAIVRSIIDDFPKCLEIETLGTFKTEAMRKPIFAFSNAILHKEKDDADYKISYADELGIVKHDDENLYLPTVSKVNAGVVNSQFEQDKLIIYKEIAPGKQLDFTHWATLMNEVYKINDNGKFAVLFAVISAHASAIFEINNFLTVPFFVGPTSSGKSQIAESIRSLFVARRMQRTNLNFATLPAIATLLERYSDIPIILEEYNDREMDDKLFQLIKAAIYDRQGRQKKSATSKGLDFSKINAMPILLGQEVPSRDDGSVYNRCIAMSVPTKKDWTKEETDIFNRLKAYEDTGLCHILIEIVKLRSLFETKYQVLYQECINQMKDTIKREHGNQEGQTRLLNTVSILLATCRLLEEHAPHLKLPFTYAEFFQLAEDKIIEMAKKISQSNRLGVFFKSIMTMEQNRQIIYGREFLIKEESKIRVEKEKGKKEDIVFDHSTKLLFIQPSALHTAYLRYTPNQKDLLNFNTFSENIKSHSAYIGQNSCRFSWKKAEASEKGISDNTLVNKLVSDSKNTNAFILNYETLAKEFDIDIEEHIEEPLTAEERFNSETPVPVEQESSTASNIVIPDLPF